MLPFRDFESAVRASQPGVAVVLGSGLGSVPHQFAELASIPFADVPGLASPSVHGHAGRIALGTCSGRALIVFRGRLHFYEGHPWDRVTRPVSLMAAMGVKVLILTNAAGGLHESLGPGDLMVLRNHLLLQTPQAWKAVSQPRSGPYSAQLIELLQETEAQCGRTLMAGVYAAVTGPCYETPAEIRALKATGADAVGMSTAWEALAARECGMDVAAVSCITNKAAGLTCQTLDHKEVLANATKPAERISEVLETFVAGC